MGSICIHLPVPDGNCGAAKSLLETPRHWDMKWKMGMSHFLLKRVRKSPAWGEAEADLNDGHIHVRQQSTEEREVPSETQGGLVPPVGLVPWLGWPPPPRGQDNVPAALSKH